MKFAPKKKAKPPPGATCVRTIRRSDGTENPCLLPFDHDLLIWCQDRRAVDALEDLKIYGERVEMLLGVMRLFRLWPASWTADEVRRYGWELVWMGKV